MRSLLASEMLLHISLVSQASRSRASLTPLCATAFRRPPWMPDLQPLVLSQLRSDFPSSGPLLTPQPPLGCPFPTCAHLIPPSLQGPAPPLTGIEMPPPPLPREPTEPHPEPLSPSAHLRQPALEFHGHEVFAKLPDRTSRISVSQAPRSAPGRGQTLGKKRAGDSQACRASAVHI